MRAPIFAGLLALCAGAAAAQPINENPPTWTIQCIGVSGSLEPTVCKTPPSRLDRREDICWCPAGGMRVEVPICAAGQTPPPESGALERVRRKASRDGSLKGDLFEGRPICAAPRKP
ncbi:hypothetical protein [Phenylobacterium zucineum]|uniref:hypothetical protein n=1 Tax=Phenylobacterium zucineum TaxID=284016 RepID=UPI0003196B71|nr:hypothetical protein [Phenylobacterium zucineum]